MKFRFQRKLLAIPYLLFLGLFVVLPIFFVAYYAFTDSSGNFTLLALTNFFTSTNKLNVLLTSLTFSFINTVICLVIGYPIAYILSNKSYNKNGVIIILFIMPMWINFVLRTWATRDVLNWIGLGGGNNPYVATTIGLVYNFLPFVIMPLYNVMLKLDKSQIEAARDLGCNRVQTFTKSIFPQSIPGVVSAAMMVFMPTMSSYVISDVLSEGKIILFGNSIYLSFTNNLWNVGSFISLIMLVLVGVSMLLSRNYTEKVKEEGHSKW
ncbi:MAG TPA: ABC transporter permease [Candidatus Onthovivens sp.]|nr:ABC transporter permease [Candidatus Onthovivens sp.]